MSIKKGAFCAKKCIIKKNLSINNFSLYNLDKYYGRTGKATGERWRYVTDNYRKTETEGNRYIGERTVLYAGGTAIGVKSEGRSHYLGNDVQGSTKTITDDEGYVENEYTYDAFGAVISGTFTDGVEFAYCGKIYDPVTGNLNYGFRDYAPAVARFTTVDPARDGSNWFAYCNGDAVNYTDLWGLTSSDSKINGSLSEIQDALNQSYFNDPDTRPQNPYYQNSAELQPLNKVTKKWENGKWIKDETNSFRLNACNFMSYLFIVQDFTDYNFSLSEIATITAYSQMTTNPTNSSEKCMLDDYNVRNPDVIMNKAFEMTGHPELTATVGYDIGDLPCRTYTNIKVLTELNNEHRVVGDFEGNVIFNPWKDGIIKNKKETVLIYIHGVIQE